MKITALVFGILLDIAHNICLEIYTLSKEYIQSQLEWTVDTSVNSLHISS